MAELRKVDELDGPPTVGEDYLVLSVRYPQFREDPVPVLGRAHDDKGTERYLHFHADLRFIGPAWVVAYTCIPPANEPWFKKLQDFGLDASKAAGKPEYRRFTCLRELPAWQHWGLTEKMFPDACRKAIWRNGKPFCPHHHLPLAQFWDGNASTVFCPAHGLEVDLRKEADPC